MKGRRLAVLAIALITVIAITAFFVSKKGEDSEKDVKSATNTQTISSKKIGMTVQKDTGLAQQSVSEEGKANGQLWKFGPPAGSQQEFLIDANYEQGASLKKLTGYTKQSLRDSVVANINLQLPKQYPDYKELTQRNLTINGVEANETIFEYDSQGVKVKQRLVLYFKNSDTAVYVRAQAKASEFDELNNQYFESVFSSVKFD